LNEINKQAERGDVNDDQRVGGTPGIGSPPTGNGRDQIDRDFRRLWLGQTISLVGTQVSLLAIPLTAAIALHASATQMGMLGASQWLPFLLLGLPAGVWVDRQRRRPVMIMADLARALSLGVVPVAAAFGILSLPILYVSVFATGVLQVLFELSYQSYIPVLVGPERLMRANSRIQASVSGAEVAGPGIAGIMTQLVTAPGAVLVDAVSYIVSAWSIASIRTVESPPAVKGAREPLRRAVGAGLRLVGSQPILRSIAIEAGVYNLFDTAMRTLIVLFAVRRLGMAPGLFGVVLALGAVGSVAGAVTIERREARWRVGRVLVLAYAAACFLPLAIPLAGGPPPVAAAILFTVFAPLGFALAVVQIYVWSIRQSIVPPDLLGRMNAAYRFIVSGTLPLGAVLGGALGSLFGLRGGIAVSAAGIALAIVPILLSPIPTLRGIPHGVDR
jgi:predicted MFS family arabinose efflux permease